MKREVEITLSRLNTYEKQEVISYLLEELTRNHNHMLSNLNNIDDYIFGMQLNKEANNLNGLTCRQLDNIKKLSEYGRTV